MTDNRLREIIHELLWELETVEQNIAVIERLPGLRRGRGRPPRKRALTAPSPRPRGAARKA